MFTVAELSAVLGFYGVPADEARREAEQAIADLERGPVTIRKPMPDGWSVVVHVDPGGTYRAQKVRA